MENSRCTRSCLTMSELRRSCARGKKRKRRRTSERLSGSDVKIKRSERRSVRRNKTNIDSRRWRTRGKRKRKRSKKQQQNSNS